MTLQNSRHTLLRTRPWMAPVYLAPQVLAHSLTRLQAKWQSMAYEGPMSPVSRSDELWCCTSDDQGRPEVFIILTCTSSVGVAVLWLSPRRHLRPYLCPGRPFFFVRFSNELGEFRLHEQGWATGLQCLMNRKHLSIPSGLSFQILCILYLARIRYCMLIAPDAFFMSFSVFDGCNLPIFSGILLFTTLFLSLLKLHVCYVMILNHSNLGCIRVAT